MKKELISYKNKIEDELCNCTTIKLSPNSLCTVKTLLDTLLNINEVIDEYTDDKTLSYRQINQWVKSMTGGEHYTMEKAAEFLEKYNLDIDALLFYAAINAQYSDYHEVFTKYGQDTDEFYIQSALAFWFNDTDAIKEKLAVYYNYIAL